MTQGLPIAILQVTGFGPRAVNEQIEKLAEDANSVRDFCTKYDIWQPLEEAMVLAKDEFHPAAIRLQVENDPEGEQPALVIEIDVNARVDDTLNAYARYKTRWLASIPVEKASLVRLLYNIV